MNDESKTELSAADALAEHLELCAVWIKNIKPEELDLWRNVQVTGIRRVLRRYAAEAGKAPEVEWLGTLLARIHRDGGHYQAEHGTQKAVTDADQRVADLNALADTAPALIQELLDSSEAEAKAMLSLEVAKDNFSSPSPEMKIYEAAAVRASDAQKAAREYLASRVK